jgi:hypothetical protein
MSENNPPKTPKYPWYQAEKWTDLEQGDLITNCPVLAPTADLAEKFAELKKGINLEYPLKVNYADLVIMSQTCDLAHNKIDQVLLCAYFPASSHSKDQRKSIRKEQRPPLHMIEQSDLPNFKFDQQIVDFRTIYTLPKEFVANYAKSMGKRVRLLSPYKEHLSQAFARYFMRVGLPRPLKDE